MLMTPCHQVLGLYEQFVKSKDQGMDKDFSFNFASEDKLKGNQLKRADYYHYLLPGTTKRIKSKVSDNAPTLNNVTLELDDISEQFKIGMLVFKKFDKVEHKGKFIGYDSQHRLYEVEYENGDKEEF